MRCLLCMCRCIFQQRQRSNSNCLNGAIGNLYRHRTLKQRNWQSTTSTRSTATIKRTSPLAAITAYFIVLACITTRALSRAATTASSPSIVSFSIYSSFVTNRIRTGTWVVLPGSTTADVGPAAAAAAQQPPWSVLRAGHTEDAITVQEAQPAPPPQSDHFQYLHHQSRHYHRHHHHPHRHHRRPANSNDIIMGQNQSHQLDKPQQQQQQQEWQQPQQQRERSILNNHTGGRQISSSSSSGGSASMSEVDPTILATESTVLRELKETVQKQATEILALQQQLKQQQQLQQQRQQTTSTPSQSLSSGSHHGHGHGLAGVGASSDAREELMSYLKAPFYQIAGKRVGWLGLFLMSLSLTAVILNGFEHTLSRHIELAYFVPLLAGHGGNTGGQAVGTVLSALSSGMVTLNDAPRVIAKEALSGLTMGLILGTIVGVAIHTTMGISLHVSTVMLCALPLVSTIAATLGSAIPFVCVALGLNPSVIAAPAMTSFVDVSGLASYFFIAHAVFAQFGLEL